MPESIYVLIDHNGTNFNPASLETLVFGQELVKETGRSLHALLLGCDAQDLAAQLCKYQLDSVIYADDPRLESYTFECQCEAISQIVKADNPSLLLMAHTYQNLDMAPRLSARLGKALVSDCVGYKMSEGEIIFIRKMFRAKLYADVKVKSEPPWIVTLQAGTRFSDALVRGSAQVINREVDLGSVEIKRVTGDTVDFAKDRVDLSQAETIVAVGRGIKKQENMDLVRDLADVVNAEIGASRPVVDNDWLGRDRQIGSSGQTVAPKLYFAIGISGAIQHVVGMKSSQCIVAINSDKNAPIFNVATYGILGDLQEIVPALTKRLREVL
jgi:electron transfer flavoprotein alpha subunit